MPIPVLLLLAGGAVAAAARGASWLAERKVKQANVEVGDAELAAALKNEEFRAYREQVKGMFAAQLAAASEAYRLFLERHGFDAKTVDSWTPDAALRARIGELVVKRSPLIVPQFDMPPGMQQMNGYRMYIAGSNLARTYAGAGSAMQAGGFAVAAGAYVAQQADAVTEADRYVAAATAYVTALRKTVAEFGSRFWAEVSDDQRSAERMSRLVSEMQGRNVQALGIVYSTYVNFLRGLVGRYS